MSEVPPDDEAVTEEAQREAEAATGDDENRPAPAPAHAAPPTEREERPEEGEES